MSIDEFRQLVRSLGMSQKQLAQKLGVHRSTLQRWESGKTRIPKHIVEYLKSLS